MKKVHISILFYLNNYFRNQKDLPISDVKITIHFDNAKFSGIVFKVSLDTVSCNI